MITSSAGRQRLVVTCATCCGSGAISLLIAMLLIGPIIVIAESAAQMVQTERYAALIENSLVIGAWVALWRPLEIFLYDWWPILAEAKLFDRLGAMDVRTVSATAAECASDRRTSGMSTGPALPAPVAMPDSPRSTALWRGSAFFLLWMLLMQSLKPADLVVGLLASVGATWISLRLLPPSCGLRALRPTARAAAALPVGVGAGRRRRGAPRAPPAHAAAARVSSRCPLSLPAGVCAQHLRDDHQPAAGLGAGRRGRGRARLPLPRRHRRRWWSRLWKEERLLARALVAGRHHG